MNLELFNTFLDSYLEKHFILPNELKGNFRVLNSFWHGAFAQSPYLYGWKLELPGTTIHLVSDETLQSNEIIMITRDFEAKKLLCWSKFLLPKNI